MQTDFLQKFYDQILEKELNSGQSKDKLFRFTDIVTKLCKTIKQICSNSKIAISYLSQYILSKLISFQQEPITNSKHQFKLYLQKQDSAVIYTTQISLRLFLLSYFCKQGQQGKRRQWEKSLEYYVGSVRFELALGYNMSAAQMLLNMINRIQQVCNQVSFYQKLLQVFQNSDFDYFTNQVRNKITALKQNRKKNDSNSKIEYTPKQQFKNNQLKNNVHHNQQKTKTSKKSIKIISNQNKQEPHQQLVKRLSDFREYQKKKRMSEHVQSAKKRTIFHSRKFIKKMEIQYQSDLVSQIYIQQDQTQIKQNTQKSKLNLSYQKTIITTKQSQSKNKSNNQYRKQEVLTTKIYSKPDKKEESQTDCYDQIMARGTPPRKNILKKRF